MDIEVETGQAVLERLGTVRVLLHCFTALKKKSENLESQNGVFSLVFHLYADKNWFIIARIMAQSSLSAVSAQEVTQPPFLNRESLCAHPLQKPPENGALHASNTGCGLLLDLQSGKRPKWYSRQGS